MPKPKKYYWIEKLTASLIRPSGKAEWECWEQFTNKRKALKEFKLGYFVNGKPDKNFRLSEVTVTPIDIKKEK